MEKKRIHISYQSDNLAYPEIIINDEIEEEKPKKTLIVIDMQNDFIDGALGTKEAVAIVENVKRKINEYKERGDEIIFTQDTHHEGYLWTNEGKHLPVTHCVEGSDGWKIREGLYVEGSPCILKFQFGYTGWKDYNLEDVELVGLCTDICVVSNALIIKALYPEIPVKVDSSCCAGVTPESHKAALETMKMCQVEVI
ncbi:MAG: cysteine hydrolase [Lachnospiraceae bacterium]|nr:cysteine hydrolase [Lachnospiraceae bacterium]